MITISTQPPDDCIACTSCVVHCPVSAVTARFRGPRILGPALQRFRLAIDDAERSLDYCSGCGTCDISCPAGVAISGLEVLAKAQHHQRRRHRLRDWIVSHGERLAPLARPLAPLANAVLASSAGKAALRAVGIGGAPLPRYARRSFSARFRRLRQIPRADKVVFFPGCFIEDHEPEVGLDLVAVMQAAGFEVVVPEGLVCCGTPLVSNGYLEDAVENGRRNLAVLAAPGVRGLPIVTACTSCSLALRREYREMLALPGAAEVTRRTYDATEFLLELPAARRPPLLADGLAARILYHAPCHLRAQGAGQPSVELLRLVPRLEVVNADAGCCGLAGSYGFKADRYEIAMKVGAALFARVAEVEPDLVASECGTCRLQIHHATRAQVVHPLHLLRRALAPVRAAAAATGDPAGAEAEAQAVQARNLDKEHA